jgi:hypothetical protein
VNRPGQARTIGPYTLLRELGRGGMGVVYEARGPAGQLVALKLLLEAGEVALKRFEREARALGAVTHPNIVRVHQYERAPEGPYLVTELVPGEGLDRVCARGPLPPLRAAEVARQLADAVARAHAAGVLHRDLKPQNVILRPDGVPVLLDFGLARAESAERLTQTGALVGTPAYMAPEQAGEGAHALDERADVYGLGAVLFHLLHARPPFSGDGPVQLVKKVLLDEPEWPSPSPTGTPAALEAVCRRAMAKDRLARYPSAAALREDLTRFVRGEATQAQPRARRSALPVVLAVGALALAAGALALVANRRGAEPEPAAPRADAAASTSRAPADPVQEAERALREAERSKDPRGVAEAAARLLGVSAAHVRARRALDDARQQACWTVSLGAPSGVRFLPGAPASPRLLLTTGGAAARVWDLGRPADSGPLASRRSVASDMSNAAIDAARGCAWLATAGQVVALALPSLDGQGAPIPLPIEGGWSAARSIARSRDGAWLAVACGVGEADQSGVLLVDLEARRARLVATYEFPIIDVTFDRDGALWAVGGRLSARDEEWSVEQALDLFLDGERAPAPADPGSGVPTFVVPAPDGAVVIGTSTSELRLLDRARKKELPLRLAFVEKERRGREDNLELPTYLDAVSFDDRWLIVAAAKAMAGRDDDSAVVVYDLQDAEARLAGRERLEPAWTVVIPAGRRSPVLVDVSDDGQLIVVALADGEVLAYPFFPPR